MKTILFIFLISVIGLYGQTEEKYYWDRLSYEQFKTWVLSIKIPGYDFNQVNIEGSKDVYNIEYSAMYSNSKNEIINIRIGHPDIFYSFEDLKSYEKVGPYYLNDFPTVFVYNQKITKPSNMTYLLVQLPNLQATFSMTAVTKERLTQEEIEALYQNFNLQTIEKYETADWPAIIPIPFRLPGKMKEITKQDTKEDLVKSEYQVKVEKSNEFIRDLNKFYKERKGWLDMSTYGDITLICKTTEDIKVLEQMKNGSIIEFVYYIK